MNLFPILAWLPDEFLNEFYASQLEFDHITEGAFTPHVVHYLAISATHWSFLIGLASQLRDPLSKIAPMWQVTAGVGLVTLTYPFADISRIPPPVFVIIGLALAAGLLHPAKIFHRRPTPWNPKLSIVALLAAVPTLLLIVDQLGLQSSGVETDTHWQGLHYNFMAEYGIVLLLVLALGASSLPGWRFSMWTGAFLTTLMGLGFVVYPDIASSQGLFWGVAAIGFGIAWLLVGENRHRATVTNTGAAARR